MSRGQTLRALVNERLASAAEDIFVLFERTIAEYEEELCRYKEENQRKRQLLDKVLNPSTSPGSGLNQEIAETPWIKEEPEEQSIKQEGETLPVSFTESSAVCVKTEVSSLLQQRQTEKREEMQLISSDQHFLSQIERQIEHSSKTDNNNDYDPFSCSAPQMETEANGNHYSQVQTRDRSIKLSPQNRSAPETTVHSEHTSGAHRGEAERKKHQCPFCNKKFERKYSLKLHMRVHTGEKPFSCSICMESFTQKGHLDQHEKIHTGEKPFNCSICEKTFSKKDHLERHKRTHTGEKPYSCSNCMKRFSDPSALRKHSRTHTGERPYSCSNCEKTFTKKCRLDEHQRNHCKSKLCSTK